MRCALDSASLKPRALNKNAKWPNARRSMMPAEPRRRQRAAPPLRPVPLMLRFKPRWLRRLQRTPLRQRRPRLKLRLPRPQPLSLRPLRRLRFNLHPIGLLSRSVPLQPVQVSRAAMIVRPPPPIAAMRRVRLRPVRVRRAMDSVPIQIVQPRLLGPVRRCVIRL